MPQAKPRRFRDSGAPLGACGHLRRVSHARCGRDDIEADQQIHGQAGNRCRSLGFQGDMTFRGKPPGSGSGEMSHRTAALRPAIALTPEQAGRARAMRRSGESPNAIAGAFGVPLEEVEKALVQMRSRRPETTRGTLNVTLDAHRFMLRERRGDEPLWQTMDRLLDELIRLRATAASRRRRGAQRDEALQPGLWR